MINSQLIMLEGMPATGKSTNSRFTHIQLERNNIKAEWFHEVATPHPVLFFHEVGMSYDEYDTLVKTYPEAAGTLNNIAEFKESTIGIHLPNIQWNYKDKVDEAVYNKLFEFNVLNFPLDKYKRYALEKWSHFTDKALENKNKVYIIDSAIFQFQIFTFLFKNRPYKELQSFIKQIEDIIKPLNPSLIYFHRESPDETINFLKKDRGASFFEYMFKRDKDQPYYIGKPSGAESFKQFLRDYSDIADLLFDSFQSNKVSLKIINENWSYIKNNILLFLDIKRKESLNCLPPNGVYLNEHLGFVIKVHNLLIIDPTEKARMIIPKTSNEFYIDLLPTNLHFEDNKITISGSQICEHWTKTGLIYDRIEL